MPLFETVALLLVLAAVFGWLNAHTLRLPHTIGIMILALAFSVALVALQRAGFATASEASLALVSVPFDRALLHGMLAFLLFAGALHVELEDLAAQKWIVGSLATFGVLVSTLLVGAAFWLLARGLDLPVGAVHCLLFGALISPTDPVAVLGILKKAGVPRSLEAKIVGESLFNDGVAIVVFLVLFELAMEGGHASAGSIAALFAQETVGGALAGAGCGLLAYAMLRSLDDYKVEVLISLALVCGLYAGAARLHLSGPIAVVVAGLLIGNRGRRLAMSPTTREHLDNFWELIDAVLNAVLFLLLGLEILLLSLHGAFLAAGILAIPIVLAARLASVALWVRLLGQVREFTPGVVRILTWGGLRGGISVALALSLPRTPQREVILAATYCVVIFSIVVQGLTIGPLANRLVKQ